MRSFWEAFDFFYADYPLEPDSGFCDFSVKLQRPHWLQRPFRPQVTFDLDGVQPFKPLPAHQAFPLFEWGLNWCVAIHMHHCILIHSAVVERDGNALILPAPPGSGKSTLCAALVARGWRLLSDELAMIQPETLELLPFPRPISLKNRSIDVIRSFAPEQMLGPIFADTHKGDVAHMKVPANALSAAHRTALPAWVVFPRYRPGAQTSLTPLPRARAVVGLADNSFNSDRLGEQAFRVLANTMAHCEAFNFEYSNLDEAVARFDTLASDRSDR